MAKETCWTELVYAVNTFVISILRGRKENVKVACRMVVRISCFGDIFKTFYLSDERSALLSFV